MKEAFGDLIGSLPLRERIRDEILQNRFSHAYLIEGPRGFGKHTLALRIAMALACEQKGNANEPLPCMSCPACKKILAGNSPDVIWINKGEKTTMGVEVIRRLHTDVFTAPNELERKVYIIEDAHTMTPQAQNAFLLTLEEPPPYVCFLLLCESVEPLLETVRSRAPTLRLRPVSSEEIGCTLRQEIPAASGLSKQSPDEFAELLLAAQGSIGRAKDLLDSKLRKPIMERRAAARELIELASSRRHGAAVLSFLSGLGQKREDLIQTLADMLLCVRDLLLCKQTEHAPLCFFANREEALSLACKFSSPALLGLATAITDCADRLRMNANVRLTMTSFAMQAGLL